MRPASTLPDLSAYSSGAEDGDEDSSDRGAPAADASAEQDNAAGETAGEAPEPARTALTPVVAAPVAAGSSSRVRGTGTGRGKNEADYADGDADPALSEAEAQRRAREREKAAAGKPVLARVLQVMIAVFFPIMVIAAAIRAVATPLFLWVEYHRPGFPSDSFGFSTDDRMTYGSYAMDYLLNWSGSRYLGDLVGDGGQPLYLSSEVSHMADVKTVLTVAFVAATVMAVLSLVAALYLRRRSPGGIRRSLFSGAVVTLVLMAVLVVLAVLGWEQFFTQVHTIFFANGNWTFRLDDTLIRLFPSQFWMDAGITIAALVLLTCIVVLVCCWPTRARRERVRKAREDARRRYAQSLEAL
ncbi:TIGR01906 family membrane protein [Arthrobacter yangruifuii]|uniref:TIGR01906 family membrane protein n=2 Tax=Arthrobacter yangruifuii TaxID=2606616 RepID=A0A5N6MJ26_9MICC|nr:TIGR01906 family membrane protein [Arthrobacter yangruifuii]